MDDFTSWLAREYPNVEVLERDSRFVSYVMHGAGGLRLSGEMAACELTQIRTFESFRTVFDGMQRELDFWARLKTGFVMDKRGWEIGFEDETEHLVRVVFKERHEETRPA